MFHCAVVVTWHASLFGEARGQQHSVHFSEHFEHCSAIRTWGTSKLVLRLKRRLPAALQARYNEVILEFSQLAPVLYVTVLGQHSWLRVVRGNSMFTLWCPHPYARPVKRLCARARASVYSNYFGRESRRICFCPASLSYVSPRGLLNVAFCSSGLVTFWANVRNARRVTIGSDAGRVQACRQLALNDAFTLDLPPSGVRYFHIYEQVPAPDMETPEARAEGCLHRNFSALTVDDVYEIAKLIGTDVERIIDGCGKDCAAGLVPKIVKVLELLENFASRNHAHKAREEELLKTFETMQLQQKKRAGKEGDEANDANEMRVSGVRVITLRCTVVTTSSPGKPLKTRRDAGDETRCLKINGLTAATTRRFFLCILNCWHKLTKTGSFVEAN